MVSVSTARSSIDLLVHFHCILTNVMLLTELSGCSSSPFDVAHDRLEVEQELLNFHSLRLHRLREFCVFDMRCVEFVVQGRFRVLEIRGQVRSIQIFCTKCVWPV